LCTGNCPHKMTADEDLIRQAGAEKLTERIKK